MSEMINAEQAEHALRDMSHDELLINCKEAYNDIFETGSGGRWMPKFSHEKLVLWFLMYFIWNEQDQMWVFSPAVEKFVANTGDE